MSGTSTEAFHPASRGLHLALPQDVMDRLLSAQVSALSAIRPAIPALARAAEDAAVALGAGRRLIYAGAGSSGLMALSDCLELAGTFGIPPARTPMLFAGGAASLLHMRGGAEDDLPLAAADLAAVGPAEGDVMIAVSASGATPYTLEVAKRARAAGASVVGIANVPGAPLLTECNLPVLIETGPEVIAGSTRMGAATAQKAALNMISVLIGIRLGHVHDGMMVNLVADNAKLADRAARIVADIAECDPDAARAALAKTGGAVKPAVLVARGAEPERARTLLHMTRGHLAPALLAMNN